MTIQNERMLATLIAFSLSMNPKVWVTLIEKGPTPWPDQKLLDTLQNNHTANLEAMRLSGKLVTYGPVDAKTGSLVGIAFFDVPKQREIADGFAADQMVQRGYVSARTVRMNVVAGILHPEPIDAKTAVPVTMAVAQRIGNNKKGMFARHDSFVRNDAVFAGLRFVCRGYPSDPEQEVQFYVQTDPQSVANLLANDPMVQAGSWRYDTYTVRLPKGCLAAMLE